LLQKNEENHSLTNQKHQSSNIDEKNQADS